MIELRLISKNSLEYSFRRALYVFFVALFAILPLLSLQTQPVNALSGSSFNPGYIISDAVFYNSGKMNQFDIQNWLNAQVPICDTAGTKIYSGSTTRAAYSASKGHPAPFTCLKDYRITTGAASADGYCGYINGGNRSAAELITAVSQACGINPQVLLVLLQKEQGLVTDDWPWPTQYAAATGYECPDTASCNPQYSGLFNQLYWGARQYKYYKANPTQFNFRAGRTQNIQYNPVASCGGSQVYIQNQATAGLYNYTPYQPNPAALNNLNSTGDSCSAYGNRNFWRMFNNWFGDPTTGCSPTANTRVIRLYDPKTYKHFYTINECEANSLVQRNGYILEGAAFGAVDPNVTPATPIFRMYNTRTGIHFYATNQPDIYAAGRAGYTYEGVAFYVASPGVPGASPVYRMYNHKTYIHLWVTNQTDIAAASRAGYSLEGPNFYATP